MHAVEALDLFLRLLALGDVGGDATVSRENARRVEHGLAARRDVSDSSVGQHPLVLQLAERLARCKQCLVLIPASADRRNARQLPPAQADRTLLVKAPAFFLIAAGELDEPVLRILRPEPVGGEHAQAAEALLALTQPCLVRPLLPHVTGDGGDQPRVAGAKHVSRRLERQEGAVLAAVVAFHAARQRRLLDQRIVGAFQLGAADRQDIRRPHLQQLPPGVAQQPAGRLVDVDVKHAGAVGDQDHVRGIVERQAKALQVGFAAPALLGFAQLARHGRGKPGEAALHQIVVRAGHHRLDRDILTDRAGHENERDVGVPFLADLERGEAAEARHGKIGQHDLRRELLQSAAQIGLGLNATSGEIELRALQLMQGDLGVLVIVFDQQNLDRCGHLRPSRIYETAAGRGKSRIAKKRPPEGGLSGVEPIPREGRMGSGGLQCLSAPGPCLSRAPENACRGIATSGRRRAAAFRRTGP